MLTAKPTKHGTGLTLWGDYFDLGSLYDTVHRISEPTGDSGDNALNGFMMAFAYEIRKARDERRHKKKMAFGDNTVGHYLGFNYLWTDMLVVINVLRDQAGFRPTDKIDQANLYALESITQWAMSEYDPKGAATLELFINQRIPIHDPLIMQIVEHLNLDYINAKPNKTRFRNLHREYAKYFSGHSQEYQNLKNYLVQSAFILNTTPDNLTTEDSEYPEEIIW